MENQIKHVQEYFSWQYQVESCDSLEEISVLERNKAKIAFAFLKKYFGDDFPKEIMVINTRFRTFFWNKVPWTRVWFTWLGEAIKNLENSQNFKSVIKKLRSSIADDFEEALTLLEYGLKFVKAGFNVDFERGTTNAKGENTSPDIYLTNIETGEKIFVEITRLKPNPEIEEMSDIFYRSINQGLMNGKQINCSGRLFKSISRERLKEIKQEVDKKVESVLKNNSFEEIKKEGVIEMAFAGQNHYNTLVQWAEENGYKIDSFALPEIDKFKRLKSKIVHKAKQSSPNYSNLLIIKNDDYSSIANPDRTFDELEETLYKCEDLLGVIIVAYQFGGKEKQVQSYGMNTFITRTERHALTSLTGIMLNKFYKKVPVTLHTLTRLIEAFERN